MRPPEVSSLSWRARAMLARREHYRGPRTGEGGCLGCGMGGSKLRVSSKWQASDKCNTPPFSDHELGWARSTTQEPPSLKQKNRNYDHELGFIGFLSGAVSVKFQGKTVAAVWV